MPLVHVHGRIHVSSQQDRFSVRILISVQKADIEYTMLSLNVRYQYADIVRQR